ncbi:hypothetical protein F383_31811 [Gossypium arboreum]|uniref:Uncharacterized protein n=1 Tax=Gossypium arboreum TaxID=29729 RepID=A0A0B0N2A9_GOSAR|nr:hypothetical protein F383_31811 [Gossypium arboreum]
MSKPPKLALFSTLNFPFFLLLTTSFTVYCCPISLVLISAGKSYFSFPVVVLCVPIFYCYFYRK